MSVEGNIFSSLPKSLRLAPVLLIGAALVFFSTTTKSEASLYIAVAGGLVVVLSASVEMFAYLQNSRRRFLKERAYIELKKTTKGQTNSALERELNKFRSELALLKEAFSKGITGSRQILTADEIKNLADRLATQAEEAIKAGAVAEVINRFSNETSDSYLKNIRAIIGSIQNRLEEEVSALGSRANINLIIGNAISFIGVAVLGYFVFTFPTDMLAHGTTQELVIYFLTRFSLVAFIEIFAYFFLRLYRYSIFEIKYFQNEMTNAQFRAISLEAALVHGDATTIRTICVDLSKTERNFLLKKGDSTLGLRTMELEQGRDRMVVEIVERTMAQWSKPKSSAGAPGA